MSFQKFPTGLIVGGSFQATLSRAAAWIASYSFGATTPRKLPFCTIWTPGMCATDDWSMLSGTGVEPSP